MNKIKIFLAFQDVFQSMPNTFIFIDLLSRVNNIRFIHTQIGIVETVVFKRLGIFPKSPWLSRNMQFKEASHESIV